MDGQKLRNESGSLVVPIGVDDEPLQLAKSLSLHGKVLQRKGETVVVSQIVPEKSIPSDLSLDLRHPPPPY